MVDFYTAWLNVEIKEGNEEGYEKIKKIGNFYNNFHQSEIEKMIENSDGKLSFINYIDEVFDDGEEKNSNSAYIKMEFKYDYIKEEIQKLLDYLGPCTITGTGFCYYNEFTEFSTIDFKTIDTKLYLGEEAFLLLLHNNELEEYVTKEELEPFLIELKEHLTNLYNNLFLRFFVFKYRNRKYISEKNFYERIKEKVELIKVIYVDKEIYEESENFVKKFELSNPVANYYGE